MRAYEVVMRVEVEGPDVSIDDCLETMLPDLTIATHGGGRETTIVGVRVITSDRVRHG